MRVTLAPFLGIAASCLCMCVDRPMPLQKQTQQGHASVSPFPTLTPNPSGSMAPTNLPNQTWVPVPPGAYPTSKPTVVPTSVPTQNPIPTTGSHFKCKSTGGGYKPYWMQANGSSFKDWSQTSRGLLGQNTMPTQQECERAVQAANHTYGVICSRTGLSGWKPTLYTGTVPGRADYGYLGGSTIERFDDCLKATQNSSSKGVCYWGGFSWNISAIDREQMLSGTFSSVDQCIQRTK